MIEFATKESLLPFFSLLCNLIESAVTQCAPPVPGVQDMIAELNRAPENFFQFVRGMRKRFQQVAMHGGV